MTYSKGQSGPGRRAFRYAALPLHRWCGMAPHLGKGPWLTPRRREGETGPAATRPPSSPFALGRTAPVRAHPRSLLAGSGARPTSGHPTTAAAAPAAGQDTAGEEAQAPSTGPGAPTHQGGRGSELGASEHLSGRRPGGHNLVSLRREGKGEGAAAAAGSGDGGGWRGAPTYPLRLPQLRTDGLERLCAGAAGPAASARMQRGGKGRRAAPRSLCTDSIGSVAVCAAAVPARPPRCGEAGAGRVLRALAVTRWWPRRGAGRKRGLQLGSQGW